MSGPNAGDTSWIFTRSLSSIARSRPTAKHLRRWPVDYWLGSSGVSLGFCIGRAGLGRAPLLACTMLTLHGMDVEQAWAVTEECRGQPVPDTPAQRAWPRTPSVPLSLEEALALLQTDSDSLM